MDPPLIKTYRSYNSPKPRAKPRPKSKRKTQKSSNSSKRLNAAQKIQRTFRNKRVEERPPTTRPSVQEMSNRIYLMMDLKKMKHNHQANRKTDRGERGYSRVKYTGGATGSW